MARRITKQDLIERMASEMEVSRAEAARGLEEALDALRYELLSGHEVQLRGFGTFRAVTRAARMGRNPATGEAIEIPERMVVKFKPSKQLQLERV